MQHQEVTLAFSHQKLFLFLNTSHFHKPQMLELNLDLFLPVSLRATSAWNTPVLLSVCVCVFAGSPRCIIQPQRRRFISSLSLFIITNFFSPPFFSLRFPLYLLSATVSSSSFCRISIQRGVFPSPRSISTSFFSHLRLSFRFNVFYFGFTKNWTLWLFCSLLFPSLPCCVVPSSLFLSLPLISFLLFPASFLTIHWIPTILSSSKRGSWRE